MNAVKAIPVKFIMIFAVLWIVLGLFGASFSDIVITSVLVTGVSFLADIFLLPFIGNVPATLADFALSFAMIWFLGAYLFDQPIRLGIASFLSAIIIAIGEYNFHRYLQKRSSIFPLAVTGKPIDVYRNQTMQTEFGEEFDVKPVPKKPKIKHVPHRPKKRRKKNPY